MNLSKDINKSINADLHRQLQLSNISKKSNINHKENVINALSAKTNLPINTGLLQNISNSQMKDLDYQIQLQKISKQSNPNIQQAPVKSISKVDENMIREYNEQFQKNKVVPILDEEGNPVLDINGKPMTKVMKYIPLVEPAQAVVDEASLEHELSPEDEVRIEQEKIRLQSQFENLANLIREKEQEIIDLDNSRRTSIMTSFFFRSKKNLLTRELQTLIQRQYNLRNETQRLNNIERENASNILHNQSIRNQINLSNKAIATNYYEQLKILNSGAFNTDKNIGETDDAYFNRLKQNAEQEEPNDLLFKATLENNKLFKNILKKIINNNSLIEQVSNSLTNEEKLLICQKKALFIEKFTSLYGIHNKAIVAENVIEFCKAFDTSQAEVNALIDYVSNSKSSSGIHFSTIEDIFSITNKGKSLFFKIVIPLNTNHPILFYSRTASTGSFRQYINLSFTPNDTDIIPLNFKQMAEYLNIPLKNLSKILGGEKDTTIINQLSMGYNVPIQREIRNNKFIFEDETTTYYTKISALDARTKKISHRLLGAGIENDPIDEVVPFGSVFLQLKKLYYKNIVCIKDKQNNNIKSFKNTKVSNDFVKIIMNLIKNEYPTKNEINKLTEKEKNLFERLIYLAHLHKKEGLEKHINDDTINELKHKLKLIEEDINAGNNNKELLKELENILMTLVDYKAITYKSARNHYLQYLE